jgi:tetratricopeptide (TPR) repeat protein
VKSLLAVFVVLLLLQPAYAQRRSTRLRAQPPLGSGGTSGLLVSGQVVLGDGSSLTEPALIQSVCQGQKRNETRTDSHGYFSFQFGTRSSAPDSTFDAEVPMDGRTAGRPSNGQTANCDLQASLAGFTSDTVAVGTGYSDAESVRVGRIVLHRMENVEGLTVSATTAAAPGPARKALAKGREEEKKAKWEQAEKQFQKAVSLYSKFAVAWFELGMVQLQQSRPADARKAFEQSIAADSKYVNPYHGLMQLAMHEQNWKAVVDTTEKLLALNPVNFPDAWFANSVGYFYLQNLANSEKSARRGLAIDSDRHVPRLEYLLGLVLMKKSDYAEAARHFQIYLRMATNPTDIADTQKQLDELTRLASNRTQTAPVTPQ